MPQMSPIMWTTMMMMFSLILMTFITMNYFTFNHKKMKVTNKNKKMLSLKWMW
uniref:ATP synthase F0 subunit 8 n=1 Tax=Erianthus versicolor TaxID=470935 RepID=UPI00241122AE|nr:ATP synthase F0 subunit 8 [Erianthus versicolor]WEL32790.1 ATP synthase F0 subunit 8 [Erianthus versicolor]